MKSENSNGTETVRATGSGAWGYAALAVIFISITLGTVILRNQGRTIETVDRLILNGDRTNHDHIMHYIYFTLHGKTTRVDLAGNASMDDVKDIIQALIDGEDPSDWKITEWTILGGGKIKVSTPHLDGETEEEHCARHDAAVEELQEQFPPI